MQSKTWFIVGLLSVVGCGSSDPGPGGPPPSDVPKPAGQASLVAPASASTASALGIQRWEIYFPATLTWPITVDVVAINKLGGVAERLRDIVQLRSDGTLSQEVSLYRDGGWNERFAFDKLEARTDTGLSERTRQLMMPMLEDLRLAAEKAKQLGTASAGTPYDDGCGCSSNGWKFGLAVVGSLVAAGGILACPLTAGGGCVAAAAGASLVGGAVAGIEANDLMSCQERAAAFQNNCNGTGVVQIHSACTCVCADGYEGSPPSCTQKCPSCACNIVSGSGVISCDPRYAALPDAMPPANECQTKYPEYPIQRVWNGVTVCCPAWVKNDLCPNNAY